MKIYAFLLHAVLLLFVALSNPGDTNGLDWYGRSQHLTNVMLLE